MPYIMASPTNGNGEIHVKEVDSLTAPWPMARNQVLSIATPMSLTDKLTVSFSGAALGDTVRARTPQEAGWGYYPTVPIFWGIGPRVAFTFEVYGQQWFSIDPDTGAWSGVSALRGDGALVSVTDLNTVITYQIFGIAPVPPGDGGYPWALDITETIVGRTPQETVHALMTNYVNMPGVVAADIFPMKIYFGWPNAFLPGCDPIVSDKNAPGPDHGMVYHSVSVAAV